MKLVASAITIGSGGVAGREGPMALITGGLGSWYASFTNRDGRERRLLLLVGMSAGLSAIFRSPIGAALLSVEILYADMEFEPNALLYTTIGAIVAYALNGMFVGFQPLFKVSSLVGQLPLPVDYLWYVVLGVAAGLLATVLPMVFYGARDFFRALPVPAWLRPAIGALLAGGDRARVSEGHRRRLWLDAAGDRRKPRALGALRSRHREDGRDELHRRIGRLGRRVRADAVHRRDARRSVRRNLSPACGAHSRSSAWRRYSPAPRTSRSPR